MNLVTPDGGLLFWMTLIFLLLFFVLARFGFPVITGMVEKRNRHIDESLKMAQEARARMENLAAEQAALLEKTRQEQGVMLREAAQTRATIIANAQKEAEEKAEKIIEKARVEIAAEKESALRDIRKEVAMLSVDIAEKVIRKDLENDDAQMRYLDKLVGEMSSARNSKN
ncbi:MAG: F0F1 ATP synthase subunit B [Bacteroidales bacterium]|nr:F0F1 ATP synthase subunit B [Bacteroidales bacterium]SKC38176.1 F-type H+-transporting ATPase subunit b [Bacteroidales bacterium WCE2008]MBO7366163.1 F0F1 ATP synthase subunit B [Bacteroidales bacterium]MBP5740163.1 F0F1 ATP synthase subunit B [Bacteroidales bacterium]MBQ1857188.1 F0F1 ATP synthase subunit B [Bacteroidales bacterium]